MFEGVREMRHMRRKQGGWWAEGDQYIWAGVLSQATVAPCVCVCVCVCVRARVCVCRSMWRTVAHLASVYHLHEGLDKIVVLAEHLPQPVRKQ